LHPRGKEWGIAEAKTISSKRKKILLNRENSKGRKQNEAEPNKT
jgi:hypothetical protein